MFVPECSLDKIKEVVVMISGNKYEESYKTKMSVTSKNLKSNTILETIHNSMIEILWESKTIKEIEDFFVDKINNKNIEIEGFRIEPSEDGLYGWAHFKEGLRVETVRFVISYEGDFKKC